MSRSAVTRAAWESGSHRLASVAARSRRMHADDSPIRASTRASASAHYIFNERTCLGRRDARTARAAGLRRRTPARHRGLPRAEAAASAVPRRRSGRGQDGDRQGARRRPRAAAGPAAVLRRARHGGRRVRVELSAADDRDPARRSGGWRRARGAGARHLHDAVPAAPAAAAGAVAGRRRRAGAADRRARSRRRAVRGVPARSAVRLPGDDSRARYDPREHAADRRHHVEPHARDPRRDQAPLPLSLGRLSRCGARARDRAAQVPEGLRDARARDRRVHAAAAHARSLQGARDRRDARLGGGAGCARPDHARSANGRRHAGRAAQVPGRHRRDHARRRGEARARGAGA